MHQSITPAARETADADTRTTVLPRQCFPFATADHHELRLGCESRDERVEAALEHLGEPHETLERG